MTLLFGIFNVKLPICVALASPVGQTTINIDTVEAFAMEKIHFDSSKPVYNAQPNIRVRRNDAGPSLSTSTATRKVNLKRRCKTFFVPVICG